MQSASLRKAEVIFQNVEASPQFNPQFNPVIAPVFAPNFNQSQTQQQTVPLPNAKPEIVQSEIECTDCFFENLHISGSNRLNTYREGVTAGEGGGQCNVAQARFYLKPIPDSEPSMELRTRLTFYDAAGVQAIRKVSDGV